MEVEAVGVDFFEVLYGGGPHLGGRALVLPCYEFYYHEVVSGVNVIHENHNLFIVWAGDTDGDGRISTAGHFSCVLCDVTVGGVLPWLAEGCLGINLLLILNFAPGGAEVIYEFTDGTICVACEVFLQFLEVLGANARDNDFEAHIEAGDFGPPLYPKSILVGF